MPSPIETAPQLLVNAFPVNPAYLFVRFALTSYPATPDAVSALDLYPRATLFFAIADAESPIATAYSSVAVAPRPKATADVFVA